MKTVTSCVNEINELIGPSINSTSLNLHVSSRGTVPCPWVYMTILSNKASMRS